MLENEVLTAGQKRMLESFRQEMQEDEESEEGTA